MPLENVILTTENCRYCLMCRHIAPVERVTFNETLTPHGWALLIASVRRGLMEWTDDAVDALYSAPDSGNSRAHCITDQPLPEAVAAARAQVVGDKLAPEIVYDLDATLQQWSNPYKKRAPEPAAGQGDVALFIGDEASFLWPSTVEAVVTLLNAAGIDPMVIGRGRNNGYLASSLGLAKTAATLAEATLDEVRATGAGRVLVLSPGDYFTFNQLWDERLGMVWPDDVELVEVVSVLRQQMDAGTLAFTHSDDDRPYTYVDPTHTVRVPTRYDDPRALATAVMPGDVRELFWRRERAHPAGNTALQFTKPDIAEKLTRARLEDARDVGAQILVCEDPGTLAQLSRYAGEYELEVRGLYEILAEHVARNS